jgi:hypothetical protein
MPTSTPGSSETGFLAPRPDRQPVDHCFRCGKETPPGVALCAEHNPSRLRGPSSTQMHATVFGGLVLGVVGFLVLARGAVSTSGPFPTAVTAAVPSADGVVAVTFDVTNGGAAEAMADCRFTRDGLPRPDDVAFRSPRLPAGQTITLERVLTPDLAADVAYDAERLSVICR